MTYLWYNLYTLLIRWQLALQQTSGQLGQQRASVGISRNREIYFHETQYMQKDSFEISRCITRQNKSPLILLKNITYRIFRPVHDVMRKDTINYQHFYIITIWIFHKRKVSQYAMVKNISFKNKNVQYQNCYTVVPACVVGSNTNTLLRKHSTYHDIK